MDGLLVLLAIAFAGLVLLGVPVALVRQGSLQRQIRDLQKDLGMLAQELRDLKREGLRPAKTPATELVSEPEAPQTTTSEPVTARATPARVQPAAAASVQDKAARSSVPPVARRPVSAAPTEPKAFVFTEGKMEAQSRIGSRSIGSWRLRRPHLGLRVFSWFNTGSSMVC